MKKTLGLLLFLGCLTTLTAQNCILAGSIALNSQADVNAFVMDNSGCTSIEILASLPYRP